MILHGKAGRCKPRSAGFPAEIPRKRLAAGCDAPNFPAERQSSLRSSVKIFGPPNCLAGLRGKIRGARLRCGPSQKNSGRQIALRSSGKKFDAPNSPAEAWKNFQRARSARGGLNFSTELQIRPRSFARPGIGRKGGLGRFGRGKRRGASGSAPPCARTGYFADSGAGTGSAGFTAVFRAGRARRVVGTMSNKNSSSLSTP